MAGRIKPEPVLNSSTHDTARTTSYPQGQAGKAPVSGELRTTSYKSSAQFDDRGYVTIN